MRLVITEKPSVARDLAKVLGVGGKAQGHLRGQGMAIAWCFGHMAELVDPSTYNPEWKRWDPERLPMLPEQFQIQARQGAEEQVAVLKRLLADPECTEVINACDAGREGELIFRYVMQLAACDKPVQRLWVSSMTDKAIKAAWAKLRPGPDFDPLADAARCRAEADWLVGLNATRAMTCLVRQAGGGQLLSIGRVQTPTLAMIVERDRAIAEFVPEDFWTVKAQIQGQGEEAEGLRFPADWFDHLAGTEKSDKGKKDPGDDEVDKGPSNDTRLSSPEQAEQVVQAAVGRPGKVLSASRRKKVEPPPLLYDLTALQRRANQRYGLSAQKTLEIAQALYERHKLITYPRTDARYLTPDQAGELPGILQALSGLSVYAPFAQGILNAGPIQPGKRVINAAEVGDHHAILPTDRQPNAGALNPDEKRIYDLVARRLMAALSPDAHFALAKLVVVVDPDPEAPLPEHVKAPLHFRAKGRMRTQAGWQAVDPPKKRKDTELPVLAVEDPIHCAEAEAKKGQTRPPQPHNDASILKGMETAGRDLDDAALKRVMRQSGLGTPATRASILGTLERRGFVLRDGKHLRSTERGQNLIKAVPIEELKSAELTGRWEARLSQVAEGKEQRDRFMADVRNRTGEIVQAILEADPPAAEDIEDDRPILGTCPICQTPVREGKGAYSCAKGRACSFVIFKKVAKRPVSKRMVATLLKGEKTKVLKGFKSKKGKDFEAALMLDPEGKVRFDFPPRQAPDPATAKDPAGMRCPNCGNGRIIRGRAGWGCDRWREGCGWRRMDADSK